ncbi:MAG: glucosamine--fructose-6-phosphate aminotransferase (isomerizing) [Parcubacteria group bacterium Gr01-1014_18]|nr:MAG: glucosamine--fructose-6-phosphate aminotransferase (isomerizing) [Parcubacteria group bacterium Greene0416_36]TSC81093.1 MAG: glucosamine--fructose-6-phosphate aminotransferase (isomerizing) [Parcubacteria group bacterium Gr01-1014_18]TSC98491.1 MAG: glucosamine--fructose-6-phosphate aminotransferase (isomerizing) [Parcubacteria group bacterium Greene1014_20]TSD07344.1 MAG: glucosamine--fructose-6-phosphate aminotransferase (isomerizing) [Parcubacteria group bacterium Greene0714_2]
MCGIIGYIGNREAKPILLRGLESVLYRGYDSAGLSIRDEKNKTTHYYRSPGKLENLKKKLDPLSIGGTVGIAHTRWATHGIPSEENAHPHRDCHGKIHVVHNGVIENHAELKKQLIAEGHRFFGQTDTEIIPHLLEEEKKQNPTMNTRECLRRILSKMEGAFAIVVMDADGPDSLFLARKESPLLFSYNNEQNEFLISSDPGTFYLYPDIAQKVVAMPPETLVALGGGKIEITDFESKPQSPISVPMNETEEFAQKQGFPHFMAKEIFEQPKALRDTLSGRMISDIAGVKLGGLEQQKESILSKEKIFLIGCGTSFHASLVGKFLFEEFADMEAHAEIASLFRYRKLPLHPKRDLALFISQSGETADTLGCVTELKNKNILCLGLINRVGSTIARECGVGIYQRIGPEIGVASTKAFTAQIANLALLTLFFGQSKNMSLSDRTLFINTLNSLPDIIEKTINILDPQIKKLAEDYSKFTNFLFLGRKYNYPTAMEGALKLKEISYIHAEAYESGEMKHGPLAMITDQFPTFFLCPNDSVYAKNISNMQEIKARSGPVVAIATVGDTQVDTIADQVLYLPPIYEPLSPILYSIPLQLFAYYMAVLKGYNPDLPRNLAKSVTVQ